MPPVGNVLLTRNDDSVESQSRVKVGQLYAFQILSTHNIAFEAAACGTLILAVYDKAKSNSGRLLPAAMVELDGDDIRISSRGKLAERDIVQVRYAAGIILMYLAHVLRV